MLFSCQLSKLLFKNPCTMKPIKDLFLGFNDARNYAIPEYKEMLSKFILRDDAYNSLVSSPNKYFLVGEKGTGKTTYAVYLANSNEKINGEEIVAKRINIADTDYLKFIYLKGEKKLILSDYTDIWKSILYLLLCETFKMHEYNHMLSYNKFRKLQDAIDQFYNYAFDPEKEIHQAFEFLEDSKETAQLLVDVFKFGSEGTKLKKTAFTNAKFQRNIMFIKKVFEDTISTIKIKKRYIIFIDGIDIRPSSVPYEEYKDCLKGLVDTIISLNSDFLQSIRGKVGNIKIVLLIRPDMLDHLDLHNLNNILRDNAILLDWRTEYNIYRRSSLFKMAEQMFRCQQETGESSGPFGVYWDYYFPYKLQGRREHEIEDAFIPFLRYSYYRPRDIVTMLGYMQKHYTASLKPIDGVFSFDDFISKDVMKDYSEYILGEITDQLRFYYSQGDYDIFIKFFEYLRETKNVITDEKDKWNLTFTYSMFEKAYDRLIVHIKANDFVKPRFYESIDTFLQFLYELNIICYIDKTGGGPIYRWCFRERSHANIRPKIRTKSIYSIHHGVARALRFGVKYRR